MTRRQIGLGFLALAAVVLLSLLLALSRSSDPIEHANVLSALRGIREDEEALGRLLLQIGTQRLSTYDPILAVQRDLDGSLAKVRSSSGMKDARDAQLLDSYAATVRNRGDLIEHFKSANAIYLNSSLYVPLLVHEVKGRLRLAKRYDLVNAIHDWEQTLFMRRNGRASPGALSEATEKLKALSADSSDTLADINLLDKHATMLVREQENAGDLLERILEQLRGDVPREIYDDYMARYVASDRQSSRVLYVLYAAAFLCMLGLIAMLAKLDRMSARLSASNRLLRDRAAELERVSIELVTEVAQRKQAEAALHRLQDDLEEDIAQRTRALAASEACLVDAIETLPDAFVLFDSEDRLVVCNEAYRGLAAATESYARPGVSYEELARIALAQGLYELNGEDPDVWLEKRLAAHRGVGDTDVRSELRFADGRCIEQHERRTRDNGIVGLRIDITELRKRDAASAERGKLAALGQLAGGVAHEINNLLQPALTFTDLIRDRLPPEDLESREDLDLVLESVRKARDIVKNILLFSRKQETTLEPVEFSKEIATALRFIRDLLPPGISLTSRVVENGAMAAINKTQLTQVLTNLVLNAVHATHNRGKIDIDLGQALPSTAEAEALGIEAGRSYLTLKVADNGTGMDNATLAHVFEPFFTTKPQGEGTGLGLSVAFGILKAWKGAISVESTVGEGTIFTLYVPLQQGEQAGNTVARIAA